MQIDRGAYYAWEILSFLSSYPNESWTHSDIAALAVLNRESKELLQDLNPQTPAAEVRKKLKKVKDCVDGLEEVRMVADIVRRLRSNDLIKMARGFRITDAGRKASLLQVIEIVGRPLKVADCIVGHNAILTFDCPKRHSGNCYSHEVYCQLHKQLENLLSGITIDDMLVGAS